MTTSWILDTLLLGVGIAMLLKGHYGTTRELAVAPLITAAVDAAFAAQVNIALTPVLSALLFVLQGIILSGATLVLYQDRVRLRNHRARRRRRQQLARTRQAFEQAAACHQTHGACA